MILWGASDHGMSTKFRDKMISFRISSKDYEKLRECCVTEGVRSISELARTVVSPTVRLVIQHQSTRVTARSQ